jgi:AbrB family looped-hinge helix DNA binding protein
MNHVYHVTLGAAGRVVIPVEVRRALRLKEGDEVVFEMDGENVRLANQDTILKEVQAFFREGIPEGVSLVDELLAERRDEVRREAERPRG